MSEKEASTNGAEPINELHARNERYEALEATVAKGEDVAIHARWQCGKELLAERQAHGGKQLPNGRLFEIAAMIDSCERELQFRMRFAERYPTEEEVRTAVRTCKSWTEIRQTLTRLDKPIKPEPKPVSEAAALASVSLTPRSAGDWLTALEDAIEVVKIEALPTDHPTTRSSGPSRSPSPSRLCRSSSRR